MRKLILYSAMSLDGYIAKHDGDIEWLHDPSLLIEGEDYGYTDFYKSIDTTLMGANTYRQVIAFDIPFPYKGKQNFVFSRRKNSQDQNVTFIDENIVEFVKDLKENPGGDIWLIGGGQINALLLEHALIDKIILTTYPIFLGYGIRLFEGLDCVVKLDVSNTKSFENGMFQQLLTPIK